MRLESKAMQVLVYLVEHTGLVVSRGELEEHLWPGRIVTEDAVTNAIAKLRRVFGDDARHPHVIETVPKIGYRLIAQVIPIGEVDERSRASSITTAHEEERSWRPNVSWVAGAFLILLLLIGFWWYLGRDETPIPLSEKPSIAVLPFRNLSGDREQEYFSDGITNDIITDLSKFSELLVIASNSVFVYKGKPVKAQKVNQELGARYILEGSVQRASGKLRVNAQLLDATSGYNIWAERYDRDLEDLFVVQNEMVQTIVTTLAVNVTS